MEYMTADCSTKLKEHCSSAGGNEKVPASSGDGADGYMGRRTVYKNSSPAIPRPSTGSCYVISATVN